MVGVNLTCAMHFGGLSKLHHVFIGELAIDLKPQAPNEIVRCKLLRHDAIATLQACIPTKKTIELAYSNEWSA